MLLLMGLNNFSQTSSTEELIHLKLKLEGFSKLEHHDSVIINSNNIKNLTFQSTKDSLLGSQLSHLIGNSYYSTNNYFKSIEYYDKSISLAPLTKSGKNLKGIVHFDKAFSEYEIQNYYKSYQTVKKAEAILSELDNPDFDYLLSIYADLGSEASYLGFYDEAEFYLNKGFQLYNNHKSKLSNKNNQNASKPVLFHFKYVYLYYLKQEETLLLKHLDTLENLNSANLFNAAEKLMLAVSYNHVGDYYLNRYQEKKNNSKSLLQKGNRYLDLSISLLDKSSQIGNYTQVLFNKAKFYRHSGNYNKALKTNKILCEMVDKTDERMPFFVAQKALIALDQGFKKEALNYFEDMVKHIHSSDRPLKTDYSNFTPSNIVNHTGLLVEIADKFIDKFPDDSSLVKQISRSYDLGLIQLSNSYEGEWFSESLKNYYDKTLKGVLLSRQKGFGLFNNKTLIENIEQVENRLTWKSFLQNRTLNSSSISDSIFDKEIYLRRQLVTARSNNDSILINELNHKLNKHLRGLKDTYPNIYKYVYSSFSIDDFQKSLDKNTMALRYKSIDSTLYIFKITNSEVLIESVSYSENVKNQIISYISEIKEKGEQKTIAKEIKKTLIPFSIESYENIIILPDHLLCFLPFETLVNKSGEYLVRFHNISYVNHLVFITDKAKETTLETVAIFSPNYKANPTLGTQALKGAENEASYISKLFDNTLYAKELATKTKFVQNAHKADLIHMAMHAKINNSNPELSYFMFDENSPDEQLYLEELYALKLKANLAVLSACNTGLGIAENGKGIISLQRAFIMAGVPATVSSLWEAPDKATEHIMKSFYNNLKEGQSKNLALRNAKLNYIHSKEDANLTTPYYWAGFIISGDYSAVAQTKRTSMFSIIGLGIIASVLILFGFKLIKKF